MLWTIEFAAGAERDLELLFHYLADSYLNLGSSRAEAAEQALRRVLNIRDTAERIATEPHRGAAHDDLLPGLRHLALDKAIYWFLIDEAAGRVRVRPSMLPANVIVAPNSPILRARLQSPHG